MDNSGSAFPVPPDNYLPAHELVVQGTMGITKREYFAAKALQGLLASEAGHGPIYQGGFELISKVAYEFADAMITAGEK